MRSEAAVALAVLALATGCSGPPAASAPAASRPNVLVVCIDALRADRLGAYGASPSPSPSLDALASDSVVFTNATSVASWTKPSVPSLLTGLYPDEHGVFDNSRSEVDALSTGHATLAGLLRDHGWRTGAFVENDQLLARLSGLDRGFSLYVDGAGRPPEIADRFLNWADLDDRAPWFAYLHVFDPHFPYEPDDFLLGDDEADRLRVRIAHWDQRGEFWWLLRDRVNSKAMRLDERALADLDRLYRLEIREVDAVVGRMLAALERSGVLDRTLVIVTSDHGEGFLERGRIDHGYGPYRELLHVPLLVRLPGRAHAGTRSDVLAQNLDVPATVLDVLGLPAPQSWSSRSLVRAIEEPASARRLALAQERHGHSLQIAASDGRYTYLRSEMTPERERGHATAPASATRGVRVRAKGIFDGARLVAGAIKWIAPGDPDVEIAGPVEHVDARARTVRVLGTTVAVGDGVDDGAHGQVAVDALRVGQHVRVHGGMEGAVFRPTKIARIDRSPIEIEGVLRGREASGADLVLDVGGVAVVVDARARWSGFPDEAGKQDEPPRGVPERRVVEELFDRSTDPAELHDVAATRPEELARLRKLVDEARAALQRPAPSGRPELDDDTRERLRALGYVE